MQKNTLDRYFFTPKKAEATKAAADLQKSTSPSKPSTSQSKILASSQGPKISPIKLVSDPKPSSSPTKLFLEASPKKEKILASPTKTSAEGSSKSLKLEVSANKEDAKAAKPVKNPKAESSKDAGKKPETSKKQSGKKRSNLYELEVVPKEKSGTSSADTTPKKAKLSAEKKPSMGEKRRSGGGANYLAFLNREGPRGIGTKEIPEVRQCGVGRRRWFS